MVLIAFYYLSHKIVGGRFSQIWRFFSRRSSGQRRNPWSLSRGFWSQLGLIRILLLMVLRRVVESLDRNPLEFRLKFRSWCRLHWGNLGLRDLKKTDFFTLSKRFLTLGLASLDCGKFEVCSGEFFTGIVVLWPEFFWSRPLPSLFSTSGSILSSPVVQILMTVGEGVLIRVIISDIISFNRIIK